MGHPCSKILRIQNCIAHDLIGQFYYFTILPITAILLYMRDKSANSDSEYLCSCPCTNTHSTAAARAPPRHDQRSWFQWRDDVTTCQNIRKVSEHMYPDKNVMWRTDGQTFSLVGSFWSWSDKTSTLRWSTRIHVQICPVQYMLCLLEVLESQHFTARSIEGQTRFLVRTARHKVYRVLYRRHRAQEDPPIGRIHQRYCYTCVTKIAWYWLDNFTTWQNVRFQRAWQNVIDRLLYTLLLLWHLRWQPTSCAVVANLSAVTFFICVSFVSVSIMSGEGPSSNCSRDDDANGHEVSADDGNSNANNTLGSILDTFHAKMGRLPSLEECNDIRVQNAQRTISPKTLRNAILEWNAKNYWNIVYARSTHWRILCQDGLPTHASAV